MPPSPQPTARNRVYNASLCDVEPPSADPAHSREPRRRKETTLLSFARKNKETMKARERLLNMIKATTQHSSSTRHDTTPTQYYCSTTQQCSKATQNYDRTTQWCSNTALQHRLYTISLHHYTIGHQHCATSQQRRTKLQQFYTTLLQHDTILK